MICLIIDGEGNGRLKYPSFVVLFLLAFVFLAAGTAGLLGLEWRQRGQIDLFLRGSPHQKLRCIDQVLAHLDVTLVDQNTGLMNALGLETFLVDSSLQSLVQKFIESQTQNVIEFEFLIGEQTVSVHSVKKGSSFEESSRIFLFKSEQLSGGLSEFGEQEMDSPYLSFVLEAVLADELQFVIDSFLFEGSSRCFEGGRIYVRTYLQFL